MKDKEIASEIVMIDKWLHLQLEGTEHGLPYMIGKQECAPVFL